MEDLKERYRNEVRGPQLIKAYIKSLQTSRKIDGLEVLFKENNTVEFIIDGSISFDVLHNVKQDIRGEICDVKLAAI